MQRLSGNSTARTPARAMRSTASHVPSRLYSCVLIVLLVLSAASCRTKKTALTQTQQTQQASSASQDSSVSHDTTLTTSLTRASVTADEEWQQAWLIMPIDGGGYRIEGSGKSKEQTHLEGEKLTGRTSGSTVSKTNRTASESRYNGVESVEEKKPPEHDWAMWTYAVIGLTFIVYLSVIIKKRE